MRSTVWDKPEQNPEPNQDATLKHAEEDARLSDLLRAADPADDADRSAQGAPHSRTAALRSALLARCAESLETVTPAAGSATVRQRQTGRTTSPSWWLPHNRQQRRPRLVGALLLAAAATWAITALFVRTRPVSDSGKRAIVAVPRTGMTGPGGRSHSDNGVTRQRSGGTAAGLGADQPPLPEARTIAAGKARSDAEPPRRWPPHRRGARVTKEGRSKQEHPQRRPAWRRLPSQEAPNAKSVPTVPLLAGRKPVPSYRAPASGRENVVIIADGGPPSVTRETRAPLPAPVAVVSIAASGSLAQDHDANDASSGSVAVIRSLHREQESTDR